MYQLKVTDKFNADLDKIEKTNKKLLRKIDNLLIDTKQHPRTGIGKPERLKYYSTREIYSRRIDREHRLVYEILEDKTIVILLTAFGHYSSNSKYN